VAHLLRERIRREGPIPFDRFVDAALYDEPDGFFARGGGAGRAGRDFVTSPEVGTLFGALVARALDRFWEDLGAPDPFVVVDVGAGRGRLAADVLGASPACAPALRYVAVERAAALREQQPERLEIEPLEVALGPAVRAEPDEPPRPVTGVGPIVSSLADLPAASIEGVVVANELLDNLPFRIVERAPEAWREIRVGFDHASGGFVEVEVPAAPGIARAADDVASGAEVPHGARLPVPTGMASWVEACGRMLRRGFLVVIDYADRVASLSRRGQHEWLRTYRGHERGTSPLDEPGSQDVTCDIPAEYLVGVARRAGFTLVAAPDQATWLASLGIDDLVDDARDRWRQRAHVGDLAAVAARSRISEAAALTDRAGLGGHAVFVFAKAV
jgi:SAM-dependent MidA family methyltransferase